MTTFGLVLDCSDPEKLADFWSAALGYTVLGGAGSYFLLVSGDGNKPKLLLQRVPEAKTAKNRMHLDIVTPDIRQEAVRLKALGARSVSSEAMSEHGSTWILMEDPEGNEFCVCDGGAGGAGALAPTEPT
jgi:predicted enzyme related to lactoylglutathione lyase